MEERTITPEKPTERIRQIRSLKPGDIIVTTGGNRFPLIECNIHDERAELKILMDDGYTYDMDRKAFSYALRATLWLPDEPGMSTDVNGDLWLSDGQTVERIRRNGIYLIPQRRLRYDINHDLDKLMEYSPFAPVETETTHAK